MKAGPKGRERIHWLRAEAEFRERLCGPRLTNPRCKIEAAEDL